MHRIIIECKKFYNQRQTPYKAYISLRLCYRNLLLFDISLDIKILYLYNRLYNSKYDSLA